MRTLNYFKGSNIFIVVLCFLFFFFSFYDVKAVNILNYYENFNNFSLVNYKQSSSTFINYTPLSAYSQSNFRVGLTGTGNFSIKNLNSTTNSSMNMRLPNTANIGGQMVFYMPECNYNNCYITPSSKISFKSRSGGSTATSNFNYANYISLVYLNNPNSTTINGTAFKMLYLDDENGYSGGFCDLALRYYPAYPYSISDMNNWNYNFSVLYYLNHSNYYGTITPCYNSINYNTPFNAFMISGNNNGWSYYMNFNFTMDELSITDILNSTTIPVNYSNNSLPTFVDVVSTFDKAVNCMNTTQEQPSTSFNVGVNANDVEGDTIYYALKMVNFAEFYKVVKYSDESCFLGFWCSDSPNWNFYTSVVYKNGDCYFNKSTNIGNDDYVNLDYYSDRERYMVRLSDNCNGNSVYNYFLEKPIDNVYYSTDISDFDIGESFNLTFYTNGFKDITTKLIFNYTNGNLTIYSVNGTLLLNQFNTPDIPLDFSVYEYPKGIYPYNNLLKLNNNIYSVDTFSIVELNLLYLDEQFFRSNTTYNKVSNLSTQIFSVEVNSGTIFLDTFYYGGVEISPDYQTSPDFSLTYNSKGNKCEKLYITDDAHMNISYNSYEFCNQIYNCDEVYYYPVQSTDDMNAGFNAGGLTGIALTMAQIIFLLQFPARVVSSLGFGGLLSGVAFFCLVVFFFYHWYSTHELKSTIYMTFINACILSLMGLLYVDIFVLFAFLFSIFVASEFGESYYSETSYTKFFVKAYGIFIGIMFITQISVGTNIGLSVVAIPSTWGITALLEFAVGVVSMILSILFFTYIPTTSTFITYTIMMIINVVLWCSRLVILMENFKYVKEMIPFIN